MSFPLYSFWYARILVPEYEYQPTQRAAQCSFPAMLGNHNDGAVARDHYDLAYRPKTVLI